MSPGSQQGAGFVHAVTDHMQGQGQDGQTYALGLQAHMEDPACYLDQLDGVSCWGMSWLLSDPETVVTCDNMKSRVHAHMHEQLLPYTCGISDSERDGTWVLPTQVSGSIENTESRCPGSHNKDLQGQCSRMGRKNCPPEIGREARNI